MQDKYCIKLSSEISQQELDTVVGGMGLVNTDKFPNFDIGSNFNNIRDRLFGNCRTRGECISGSAEIIT